jgi:hypothetical protein
MSDLDTAIDQLSHGQYNQFKTTVSDLLMDRLKGRIENEKYSVSQSIFNDDEAEVDIEPEQIEEPEMPEETSDEEV